LLVEHAVGTDMKYNRNSTALLNVIIVIHNLCCFGDSLNLWSYMFQLLSTRWPWQELTSELNKLPQNRRDIFPGFRLGEATSVFAWLPWLTYIHLQHARTQTW